MKISSSPVQKEDLIPTLKSWAELRTKSNVADILVPDIS